MKAIQYTFMNSKYCYNPFTIRCCMTVGIYAVIFITYNPFSVTQIRPLNV